MSISQRKGLIRTVVTLITGLAVTAYYVFSRNFGELPLVEQYRVLCDGFSLPGMFMIFFALLFTMNNLGALDAISYILKYGVHALFPVAFGEMEPYLDYVEARRENRVKGYGHLYLVGGLFMAVSLVFLVLFYTVFQK